MTHDPILAQVDHALGLTFRVVTPPRSDFFGLSTDHGDATAQLTSEPWPLPCPRCNQQPELYFDGVGHNVYCGNCYDGAPDAGPQCTGIRLTRRDAIADWNDCVEEWDD